MKSEEKMKSLCLRYIYTYNTGNVPCMHTCINKWIYRRRLKYNGPAT